LSILANEAIREGISRRLYARIWCNEFWSGGDRAIWKPDFNRGQLLPAVLILEKLNISYFLTPGIMFRSFNVELQQLKNKAVQHRHIIRNYLGVSVSEGMSAIPLWR
jgi:hypothetical protein